jgi:hypothetical protein
VASKFFLKTFVTIPVAPTITGLILLLLLTDFYNCYLPLGLVSYWFLRNLVQSLDHGQGSCFLLENLWYTDVSKIVQGVLHNFPQKFDTVIAGTQRLGARIVLTPVFHK